MICSSGSNKQKYISVISTCFEVIRAGPVNFARIITPVKFLLIIIALHFICHSSDAQGGSILLIKKDNTPISQLNTPGALQWIWPWLVPQKHKNIVTEEERPQTLFKRRNDDWRLYAAAALVLLFGLAKNAFRKMYDQLVTLMLRTTVKTRQIKEQLQHTTIPSLAFNLVFVIAFSLLLMLAIVYYSPPGGINYFLLWLLCAGGVAGVYLVKYCWLKLAGWLFNVREAADGYLFFVFFLNKILGIFLIPVVVLLLLNKSQVVEYLLIISYFLIGFFLFYRYYLAYSATQKAIKTSPFHFFLYICAVEIAPLLLIYKVLFNFLAY
jgi:Domain of unknown function (DUF4271)